MLDGRDRAMDKLIDQQCAGREDDNVGGRAMQHHKKRWVGIILIATLGLFSSVSGQGGLTLSRGTIAGGGGTLSSGGFSLTGAIGQPYAGAPLHSGSFSLTGGGLAGPSTFSRYIPVIRRSGG
jgi:hypothetical protein